MNDIITSKNFSSCYSKFLIANRQVIMENGTQNLKYKYNKNIFNNIAGTGWLVENNKRILLID